MEAKRLKKTITFVLLAPAVTWLVLFLILPFMAVLVFSVGERADEGGYQAAFTWAQYANLPARGQAFWNTLLMAPMGAILCLIIAYPVAYYLALRTTPRSRMILVALVIIPFWTSLLLRTYAWMYILGGRGLPALLEWIGIEGVRLLNTPLAVMIGIVYGYLPLMIMPIFVALEKLDKRLLEASADLGAKPISTFVGVTLPLSMSGVATGLALVSILLMGEFLIPAMLGGGKVFFVGNALVDLFLQSRNWPFGSAILSVSMKIATRISGTRPQMEVV
jgi:spermidine/putrescine transport system permease protein